MNDHRVNFVMMPRQAWLPTVMAIITVTVGRVTAPAGRRETPDSRSSHWLAGERRRTARAVIDWPEHLLVTPSDNCRW